MVFNLIIKTVTIYNAYCTMPQCITTVQVSDTTGDNNSNAVG
jgi:hypothetical protein